jgi:hypothetical protein
MPFRWPAPLARQADNVLIRRSFAWRHSVTREKGYYHVSTFPRGFNAGKKIEGRKRHALLTFRSPPAT